MTRSSSNSLDTIPRAWPLQPQLRWHSRHWKALILIGATTLVTWLIWVLFFSGISWAWVPESEYSPNPVIQLMNILFAITGGAFIGFGMNGRYHAKKTGR